jgi:hypothetical protein
VSTQTENYREERRGGKKRVGEGKRVPLEENIGSPTARK